MEVQSASHGLQTLPGGWQNVTLRHTYVSFPWLSCHIAAMQTKTDGTLVEPTDRRTAAGVYADNAMWCQQLKSVCAAENKTRSTWRCLSCLRKTVSRSIVDLQRSALMRTSCNLLLFFYTMSKPASYKTRSPVGETDKLFYPFTGRLHHISQHSNVCRK